MKCAIYARYSTDKQRDASIEDQCRNSKRYAERVCKKCTAEGYE